MVLGRKSVSNAILNGTSDFKEWRAKHEMEEFVPEMLDALRYVVNMTPKEVLEQLPPERREELARLLEGRNT